MWRNNVEMRVEVLCEGALSLLHAVHLILQKLHHAHLLTDAANLALQFRDLRLLSQEEVVDFGDCVSERLLDLLLVLGAAGEGVLLLLVLTLLESLPQLLLSLSDLRLQFGLEVGHSLH